MHLHHDRHLQTYIDNLNGFLEENPSLQKYSLEELLTDMVQTSLPSSGAAAQQRGRRL